MEHNRNLSLSAYIRQLKLTMTKEVLIGDDHELIRTGISALITSMGYPAITEASSCSEIMKHLSRREFTHLILDMELSDGSILEILPNVIRLYPEVNIAILSMKQPAIYRQALKTFGVDYVLSKSAPNLETISMVGKFLNNEPCPTNWSEIPDNPFSKLSPNEFVVLQYMAQGYKPAQICSSMGQKSTAISTYKSRIFEKTGMKNERELLELANVYNIV